MIKVELHAPVERYECVATMIVEDDGTYRFDDPQARFPVPMHVLKIPEDGRGGVEKVMLDEDPKFWARNLHTLLRNGYLVPKVVRDDENGISDEQ